VAQLDYDKIDPALRPMLESFPALDLNRDNIVRMREVIASRPAQRASVDVEEAIVSCPSADGDITLYVYHGSNKPNRPALLWIHGGGYIMGSAEDDRARIIAAKLKCTVFSVEYRIAPEHPFPAGPNDCYAALRWIYDNGASFGIDPNNIAIGGASAGSGMAAGVALMNRDNDNIPLRLQLLLYPMIDNLHATASGQIDNHPIWKQSTSFNAWEMYLDGRPEENASPYAAASRATDLAGLPPAYICVGSEDLFRDEDMAYANRLIAAGVPCELAVFPGVFHGGESFAPKAAVSQRMITSYMTALGDAFR
jgi:acetyl esterase